MKAVKSYCKSSSLANDKTLKQCIKKVKFLVPDSEKSQLLFGMGNLIFRAIPYFYRNEQPKNTVLNFVICTDILPVLIRDKSAGEFGPNKHQKQTSKKYKRLQKNQFWFYIPTPQQRTNIWPKTFNEVKMQLDFRRAWNRKNIFILWIFSITS